MGCPIYKLLFSRYISYYCCRFSYVIEAGTGSFKPREHIPIYTPLLNGLLTVAATHRLIKIVLGCITILVLSIFKKHGHLTIFCCYKPGSVYIGEVLHLTNKFFSIFPSRCHNILVIAYPLSLSTYKSL